MKKFVIILLISASSIITAQSLKIEKIEPPNWWVDHSYNNIQLLIYGENLDSLEAEINSESIQINGIMHPENSNYAFLNLHIGEIKDEVNCQIKLYNKFGDTIIHYPLLKREYTKERFKGFSTDDVIYLIFPDRFVNGDTSNDFLNSHSEEFKFGSLNGRHGGDIQGMIDKLDYLQDLGITAIWSTPLLENNMYMSYHGYAATDLYNIDPRHGTNKLYREFVEKAHNKGLKVIMDHVTNHIGINHVWISSLPSEKWLNGTPEDHLPADHNKVAYVDIHAADNSIRNANQGWFVDYMPDLNQTDTLLATYIIQNTIWWIEYSGIDGIREDTYPYANQKFLSDWAKEIFLHYPNFNIVGEVWKGDPAILATFQTNSYFPKEFDSNLPVVTDFAIRDAIVEYLSGSKDLRAIYEVLGKDFVYSNPDNLLTFFDNHDTDRGMYVANGDIFKYKVALTLVLTIRGIPQLFYGSEIGMNGGGHHGKIRGPFPGGFESGEQGAFTSEGRNDTQNDLFDFTQNMLHLRAKYNVLRNGDLIQFQPKDNFYYYLRRDINQKILVAINDNNSSKNINLEQISLNFQEIYKLTDLQSNKELTLTNSKSLSIPEKSINLYLIH